MSKMILDYSRKQIANREALRRADKAQAEAWRLFKTTEAEARRVFDHAAARAWAQYEKEYQE